MFGYYPQGLFGYSPGAVLSLQLNYSLRTNVQTIPHHSLLCKHPDRMHIYGPGAFLDFLLLQYNWWFHYSRIETDEGVLDGRPEAVRQAYYEVLWMYFDLDRAWPSHVDTYYFDLDCANRQEILSEDADRHGSVRSFLVKQWCAVYKCCQVRVDENLGRAALLEDGRTPALRSRLDTNYMMGFFSLDPLYHPLGEPRDGVGYNPLPKGLHRIQILQHRRWLESRSDASCVLYDSDEDDLFPDRDYPEREGVSRIHGKWPEVTEFAQP